MFSRILDILAGLLPSQSQPTPVWAVRLILVTTLVWGGLYTLRGTELGERIGLAPRIMMSHRSFQTTVRAIYTNLARMKLDKPQIDSGFMLASLNDAGNFIAGKRGSLAILSSYIPEHDFVNLYNLEDQANLQSEHVFQAVLGKKTCYSNTVSPQAQERIALALLGFNSDRVTICPVLNLKGESFGAVLVFWTYAPGRGDAQILDIQNTVEVYTQAIQDYMNSRDDLFVQ